MRQRLEGSGAKHLIDEGWVCLAALQGGQADACEVDPVSQQPRGCGGRGAWATGACGRRRSRETGRRGARCGTTDPSRRRWARRRPSLARQLDDRAAPDTVPMKAAPQQCGALGRLRPALHYRLSLVVQLDRPARGEALQRGVPHSNAVRLVLERAREAAGTPPSVALVLPEHVARRDAPVRPVAPGHRSPPGSTASRLALLLQQTRRPTAQSTLAARPRSRLLQA